MLWSMRQIILFNFTENYAMCFFHRKEFQGGKRILLKMLCLLLLYKPTSALSYVATKTSPAILFISLLKELLVCITAEQLVYFL